jgi:hypothetical protein
MAKAAAAASAMSQGRPDDGMSPRRAAGNLQERVRDTFVVHAQRDRLRGRVVAQDVQGQDPHALQRQADRSQHRRQREEGGQQGGLRVALRHRGRPDEQDGRGSEPVVALRGARVADRDGHRELR